MAEKTTVRPKGSVRRQRATAVVGAVIAAVAAWFVLTVLANVDLVVKQGSDRTTVGVVSVIAASLVVGLLAWLVLALIERTTRHAHNVWLVVSVAVFLLSLLGPLGAGQGLAAKLSLAVLHVSVAGVIIPRFTWTTLQGKES